MGHERDRPWQWLTDTAPFSALDDSAQPAQFVVEQIGDRDFGYRPEPGFNTTRWAGRQSG